MTTVERQHDEAKLLDAVRGGSLDALGEVYGRYAGVVYGLALQMTGSCDEAEDVLQDVFVGLSRALRSYEERGRFESWLRRVTARTALMRLRAMRRKREAPLEEATVERTPAGVHPVDRIAIQRAIARLPERLRIVFVLREVEGYSHKEIAEMLGITSGSSATRLSRAWSLLRKDVDL